MKRVFALCLLTSMTFYAASAQVKIVERSAPKAPAWIGISEPDYVIVSAEEPALDAAKQRCLQDIRQSIANAVAVNIASDELSSERQQERNGIEEIYRSYESQVRTTAGRLPFITNISLSDAEIYWEKHLEKKERRYYFVCHAKYPFPRTRRNALIEEFLRQDRAQYDKYLALKKNFDTFTRIEYIGQAITELEPLSTYFFDEMRRNEVLALQRNYRKLYAAISAVPYENALGEHVFYLSLAGRRVTTSRPPTIKSPYATDIVVTPAAENMYRVTYNYEQCLDDDENTIELIYLLGGRAVKHRFGFDVRQEKTAVIPCGEVELDLVPAPEGADRCVRITGWMNLRSKYESPFQITGLNLSAEGIGTRICTESTSDFKGAGTHRLGFVAEGSFPVSDKRAALAQGVLTLRNVQTGKSEEVRFALPYRIRFQEHSN